MLLRLAPAALFLAGCATGLLDAAVPCVPDTVNWTPTPTLRGDHDQVDVAIYRVYAKPNDAPTWWWHGDYDYIAFDPDPDTGHASFAPCIDRDCEVQGIVPDDTQETLVDFAMTAVDAAGNESGMSNVVTICMPHIWHCCEAYQ